MFEIIRKGLMAGLGVTIVTKEKVEAATKRFVTDGKISREEAERFAQDLVDSGRKQWEEFQNSLMEAIKKAIEGLDVATKDDIEGISRRLKDLEDRVAGLEDRGNAGQGEDNRPGP